MEITNGIKNYILTLAESEGKELSSEDLGDLMSSLELCAREYLAQPEHQEYFQGAYSWWWDEGASVGFATDSDIKADAKRHGITTDEILSHYHQHVVQLMLGGLFSPDFGSLDWKQV